jgi:arginase
VTISGEATPLRGLQILEVNYFGGRPAPPGFYALDAYAEAYGAAGVPYQLIAPRLPGDEEPAEPLDPRDEVLRLGALNGAIADAVAQARRRGQAIVLAGGNCSHAPGVLGGLQDAHGAGARVGLVWFDAHGDFNTPKTTLSGSLGGMPVAVCAGLALPRWREAAHLAAPIATDRILFWDVRNLDAPEAALIQATEAVIAAPSPHASAVALPQAVDDLAQRVDILYLHIDADILDVSLQPNHVTGEPHGPDLARTLAAIETVMATGQVVAYAVVSVFAQGQGGQTSVASGAALMRGGLEAWRRYGTARLA